MRRAARVSAAATGIDDALWLASALWTLAIAAMLAVPEIRHVTNRPGRG